MQITAQQLLDLPSGTPVIEIATLQPLYRYPVTALDDIHSCYFSSKEDYDYDGGFFNYLEVDVDESLLQSSIARPVVEEAGAASAHFTTEPVALTGGSVDYYKFMVEDPTTADAPYFIEVNDLIEAAGMNFAEGNIVKAIARIAGIRNGKGKPGVTGVYDAEKVVFFGDRVLKQQQRLAAN